MYNYGASSNSANTSSKKQTADYSTVYSSIGDNEYTTTAQRQQQNQARQEYITRMQNEKQKNQYLHLGYSSLPDNLSTPVLKTQSNNYGLINANNKSFGSKTVGPNRETGLQNYKTSADNQNNVKYLYDSWLLKQMGNTGPNRETVQTVKTAKDTTVYPKTYGLNAEIAKSTYLDNRGQNSLEKYTETKSYGYTDNNKVKTVVTKDNVYYQKPEKIENSLTKLQSKVNESILQNKRELENLQFQSKNMPYDYSQQSANDIDESINNKKADIETLQKIKNKVDIGLEFGYQFAENKASKLSDVSVDDILKSKEEFGHNLPYFSQYAQTARNANKVIGKVENVISVLENTKVEANVKGGFTVKNVNTHRNSFTVMPSANKSKGGYYEYSLSVTADDFSALTQEQKNLYKSLDNIPISSTAYNRLNNILDTASKIDDAKLGKISTGVVATGEVLDVVDFLCVVASDYSDDGEFGKDTTKKITGMISSWLGGMAGGELGAAGGAAIGTAILPGVGTVAGGVIGAILGAYMLSSAMEDVGVYLGGIDYAAEYDLEQHTIRGR